MKCFSIVLSLVFCLLLFACFIGKAHAKVVASPPVKVNVVGGTAISDDKIKDIFKEANKILDQADVSLDLDPNVSHGVGDQGNGDDNIDTGEDAKLDEAGQGEINGRFGKGIGLKVYFTNQIHGDNNTLGCAPHVTEDANGNLKGKPIVYIKNDPCESNKDMGNTLAHEMCHVFTLGDKDVVDINDSLKFEYSDANGHVMDINNLMHPAGNEDSNKLTSFQGAEVFNGAARHCKKVKIVKSVSHLVAPTVTTVSQMIGGWVDDMDDVVPPLGYNDLGAGFFYAQNPLANLEFSILTEGLFPPAPVNMQFSMYLNSDGNPATGDPAPIPGVDKVIDIMVTGEHPGGQVSASITDTASGVVTFLPFASTQRIKKIVDHNTAPYSEPYVDGLYLEVPMELLGENNGSIQGLLTSLDYGSGATDDVFFFWEDTTGTDPALTLLTTRINPGDPIELVGENYAPFSEISIFVDDELIGTTTADANGGFIDGPHFDPGSDPFDGGVPADAVVRARDAEGGSDYSILEIVPYEGDINADVAVDFYDVALLANNWLISVD